VAVITRTSGFIPFFLKKRHEEILPITDERMTRFNITLEEGIELVLRAIGHMWGGEIFVPRIPSYRIMDVAEAIAPGCRKEIVGIRPGEKLHEELITETDALNSIEFKDYFVILPTIEFWNINKFMETFNGKRCSDGFKYNSGTNTEYLTVEDIRELIQKHVDPTFKI